MDLTTSYPASVHEKMHGIVQLKRTLDKGKAVAEGTPGEYHYNCPMDKHLFEFLGVDHEAVMAEIKKGDDAVSAYIAPFVHQKSNADIEKFNKEAVTSGPPAGSDGEKYFLSLRNEVAPDRTDVTAWADLLDLDEKRPVPKRVAA